MSGIGLLGVLLLVVFVFGAVMGILFLASMASRKEDKRWRLSMEAPDWITLAGRFVTSLYIRRPGEAPNLNRPQDDQQTPTTGGPPRSGRQC